MGALAALTAAVLTAAPVALGQPAPDPAPVAPAPAPTPDPAPTAAVTPAPSEPAPSELAPVESAPADPAPTQSDSTQPAPAPAAPAATTAATQAPPEATAAPRGRTRPAKPREQPGSGTALSRSVPNAAFLRVESLLPHVDRDEDSPNLLLYAAGALLALVLASASLTSVLARLLPPTAVMFVLLAAPAYAEDIDVVCNTSATSDTCNHWYSASSVSVLWDFDPLAGATVEAGCANGTFTAENGPLSRTCRVRWNNGTTVIREIWIGIDRTAPAVAGLDTSRAPDHDGWFNHPVDISFRGSDSLSGVRTCSSSTYAGPNGGPAYVGGSCTDVAGNTGTGSIPINYDSIAPAEPDVEAVPGDRRVTLRWSGDEVAEVTRFAAGQGTVVYRGSGGRLVDRGLRNEERYRYLVTLVDQAGNRASNAELAVPTASRLLTPAARQRLSAPPLLTWRKVKRASYYNVQLFRGERKVLSRWPKTNELQLRRRWRFGGTPRRLVPGRYCWYVWPGRGPRAKRDYGRLLGKRCFVLVR